MTIYYELISCDDGHAIVAARDDETGEIFLGVDIARAGTSTPSGEA